MMHPLPQPLSAAALSVAPFYVMDILKRAQEQEAQGADIIHLEIGEPDFSAPDAVLKAAQQSLGAQQTHYSAALGMAPLRAAIAADYQREFGLPITSQQVAVTTGASAALALLLAAILNPGDKVLLPDPTYPCNRHMVRMYGGVDVNIPVDATVNYQLNVDLVRAKVDARTKAVMIASPSNPCGTLMDWDTLQALAQFCQERQLWLIVDEIYAGIRYQSGFKSAAALGNVMVINSFSKYFALTGLRVGWLLLPQGYEDLMAVIDKLAQNFYLCPPITAQYAALESLSTAHQATFAARVAEFKTRRDYLLPALENLGFAVPTAPVGAFYIYANCRRFLRADIKTSSDLCQFLLEKAQVAVTPGKDFGDHAASEHIRFAYTRPVAVLQQAVARMAAALATL